MRMNTFIKITISSILVVTFFINPVYGKPSITVSSPQDTVYNTGVIQIDFTISEVSNVTLTVDGSEIAPKNVSETILYQDLINIESYFNKLWTTNGAHSISINATNSDGSSIETVDFTKDFAGETDVIVSDCGLISGESSFLLDNDISNSDSTTCIDIISEDVVFDCDNNIIDGVDNKDTYGIKVMDYSTVRRCTISDWDYGLFVNSSKKTQNSVLTDITSMSNSIGIIVISSSNNEFSDIVANSNSMSGIYSLESHYNDFSNVVASLNTGDGIYLLFSDNCTFLNITTNSNSGLGGIYAEWSSNNLYEDIVSNSNLYGIGLYGYCPESCSNTIREAAVDSNTYGIVLSLISNNTITYSKISNSAVNGIYIFYEDEEDEADPPISNTIYNNLFNNTDNFYIYSDAGYPNSWNIEKETGTRIYSDGDEIGGNYWTNSTETGYSDLCLDEDYDSFCDDSYNLWTDNIDYLPLTGPYSPPECYSDEDCDDGDYCTIDTCVDMGFRNAYCSYSEIVTCVNDDSCCPENCIYDNDTDCPVTCGDGVCDSGETCSSCVADCGKCQHDNGGGGTDESDELLENETMETGNGDSESSEPASETADTEVNGEVGFECPVCPEPSGWSGCINGTRTRTNYRCDSTTEYECEEYTEESVCKNDGSFLSLIPEMGIYSYIWGVVVVILIIILIAQRALKDSKSEPGGI